MLAAELPPLPYSLEEQICDVVKTYPGVPCGTILNLAMSESSMNPLADNGEDRGLFQISRKYHSEVDDACAFNVACATTFIAGRFVDGYSSESVPCNCYAYLKTKIKNLPLMNKIVPNSVPSVGAVAIFDYSGTPHLARIVKMTPQGFEVDEANYTPCIMAKRTVVWTDSHLKGFWLPSNSP